MTDLLTAFGLVALAELGDKSQLLALSFATRYRWWLVLTGIFLAELLLLGVASGVGGVLGSALPERLLSLVGGLLFLGFAVWTWREGGDVSDDEAPVRSHRSVIVTVTVAFVVAELGDKTMLATAALATTRSPLPVWIGGVLGVTLVSVVAIAVGRLLGRRLPAHALRIVSAAAFALFGALLLIAAATG